MELEAKNAANPRAKTAPSTARLFHTTKQKAIGFEPTPYSLPAVSGETKSFEY